AFGEKDFQQLQVLRRMVEDLALPVEVVGGPIVRAEDGLALSSRNTYLSAADRVRALSLSAALRGVQAAAAAGERRASALVDAARDLLTVDALEYLELVDVNTLQPVERLVGPARALVAARVGGTRLIDNVAVDPAP